MSSRIVSPQVIEQFSQLTVLQSGGYHSAVVSLSNNQLLLWGVVEFDQALATQIAMQGVVGHIAVTSSSQLVNVDAWATAFPGIQLWAAPGVRAQAKKLGMLSDFRFDLGASPDPTWSADLDQLFVPMQQSAEVIFYHYASQTLLIADFLTANNNGLLSGIFGSDGLMVNKRVKKQLKHKQDGQSALSYLHELKPKNVLLSHHGLVQLNEDFSLPAA